MSRTESLDDIWKDDLLDRRQDAQVLLSFLVNRHAERKRAGERGAYVLNLNAGWGHGKTFFLERLQRQASAAGHPTAYINAWRDDSSQEPVVAVMAAIEASLKPHFAKSATLTKIWDGAKASGATIFAAFVKGASRKLAEKYAGQALDDIEDLLERDDTLPEDLELALLDAGKSGGQAASGEISTLLTRFVDQKIKDYEARLASAAQFQRRLRELLGKLGEDGSITPPFFIFIDELDRCRPTYAIEMLEQVKHLFDIDDAVFVIATDGDQLARSIKAVYGSEFDGRRYLLRFFHRHYRFEPRDLTAFAEAAFRSNEIEPKSLGTPFDAPAVEIFVGAMEAYHLTLRDAQQCFDLLRTAVTLWPHPVPLELSLLLPLIISFQQNNLETFEQFFPTRKDGALSPERWRARGPSLVKGRRALKMHRVETLNSALLGYRFKSLKDVMQSGHANDQEAYAFAVFRREIDQIHLGQLSEVAMSVISEYPALVRSVGRFVPPEPISADVAAEASGEI